VAEITVTEEPDVGQAARNLSDSLSRLMGNAVSYGRGTLGQVQESLAGEPRRHAKLVACIAALFLLVGLGSLFAGAAIVLAFLAPAPAWAAAAVSASFFLLSGLTAWYMLKVWRKRPSALHWLAPLAGSIAGYLRYRR
jgi:hypothetical protein